MPFFWIPAYAGMTTSGLISGKYGTRHTREGGYPDVKLTLYDFIKSELFATLQAPAFQHYNTPILRQLVLSFP